MPIRRRNREIYLSLDHIQHVLGYPSLRGLIAIIKSDWGENAVVRIGNATYIKMGVADEILNALQRLYNWRKLDVLDSLLELREKQAEVRSKDLDVARKILQRIEEIDKRE